MATADSASYRCAYCGETNDTVIDPSAGSRQAYVEDCAVCCRPNALRILIDPEDASVHVESEQES